jgi:purine-nucleoside phosphorylase
MSENISRSTDIISKKTQLKPSIAIILGTGLGGLTSEMEIDTKIPYRELPGFQESTVQGHHGVLIFGYLNRVPVIAMKGRHHYYEGYSMENITYPVKVFKSLGIKTLIVSNASGGLNPSFDVGDIMIITDHINLMNDNPLTGPFNSEEGDRFIDMSAAYNKNYALLASQIAGNNGIRFFTGTYAGVTGPTFETPSEYRHIRIIGADAVGMSTVPEVITARKEGLEVLAFSVISDLGVEGKIVKISHDEVIDAASLAETRLTKIIKEFVLRV